MVCFQTKNSNLGKFWRVLQWKILVYFIIIWSFLRPLEIFYGHLVYFVVNWYISPRFGILHQEKSGNPGEEGRSPTPPHPPLVPELLMLCWRFNIYLTLKDAADPLGSASRYFYYSL
jgi:hypothetical protein